MPRTLLKLVLLFISMITSHKVLGSHCGWGTSVGLLQIAGGMVYDCVAPENSAKEVGSSFPGPLAPAGDLGMGRKVKIVTPTWMDGLRQL